MYDAVVIGAGPAGYVSAIKMAHLGLKVAVVEREHAGGTCTNRGCIPTKALLVSSHMYHEARKKAKRLGIVVEGVSYDFKAVRAHMKRAINTSRKGVEYLFKKNEIDYIKAEARIERPGIVRAGDETLQTRNILIATGSKPTVFPPFDRVEGVWTSDDVFEAEELPKSILVVGGGVVGVEMGTFMGMLGVKVHIVEIMEHILPGEDEDIAEVVKRSLSSLGVNVHESSKVIGVDRKGDEYAVTIETPKETFEVEVERILLSVGRRPNIGEDVKELGIALERGIVTDDHLRTSVDGIYAAGDVRGKVMLAHVGFHEGIVVAYNVKGEERKVDLSVVPLVVYTLPEISSVGMKEKDMDGERHAVARFPVAASGRAAAMGEREGFAKIIYERDSGRVVGFSMVGPFASELVMEATLAIRHGLTVEELANTIHPHPTISEVLLGAFEEAEGKAIHI